MTCTTNNNFIIKTIPSVEKQIGVNLQEVTTSCFAKTHFHGKLCNTYIVWFAKRITDLPENREALIKEQDLTPVIEAILAAVPKHQDYQVGFEQRLYERWKEPLDLMYFRASKEYRLPPLISLRD